MRKRSYVGLGLLLVIFIATSSLKVSAQTNCNCFVIKEKGQSIEMEKIVVEDNRVEVINDPQVISVAFSLGEGLNGDMVSGASRGGMLIAQCKNGALKIKKRSPAGDEKPLPDLPIQDLKQLTLRVNVIGGNGSKKAFKIINYDSFQEDFGPVIDMFGGRVPVKTGDFLITTETKKTPPPQKKVGKVEFKKVDGWMVVPFVLPNGNSHPFVVDMAATATVVDKSILPTDATITQLESIAFDGDKERVEHASMQGATGTVAKNVFLGRTELMGLSVGDLKINVLSVNVLTAFPEWLAKSGIKGILGLDVLKMNGSVIFDNIYSELGHVIFGGALNNAQGANPMSTANGLYFLHGSTQGKPIQFAIDMGARNTILSEEYVRVNGIKISNEGKSTIRGIDDSKVAVKTGTLKSLTLCSKEFFSVPVRVGVVDALSAFGLNDVSLLGMDFFSRFKTIELSFENNTVALIK